MLHFFKFRQELFAPAPAKDVYLKRGAGKGWPEECPPIRAANGFGFDLLANFDVTFKRNRNGDWKIAKPIVIESDFDYAARQDGPSRPLVQEFAWFWEKGQKVPHVISDNVYAQIRNQVKLSSYLFLETDANELLYMTDVPNLPQDRGWRAMTALLDTDWYPASYPWHAVIELSNSAKTVTIKKGEPICRIMPVRRDTYFAQQMSNEEFNDFFERGQAWLATHGRVEHESADSSRGKPKATPERVVDITRTYVKQQLRSKFVVKK